MAPLMLVNPKRRRRGSRRRRAMTAKQLRYFGPRASNPRRRRRHRNPRSAVTASNPRRHRRSHSRIMRRRRNPIPSLNGIKGMVMPAAYGAAAAIALGYVLNNYAMPNATTGAAGFLPASLQTGIGLSIVEGAGAIAMGYVVTKVAGRSAGQAAATGALCIVLYNAINNYMANSATASTGAQMSRFLGPRQQMGFTPQLSNRAGPMGRTRSVMGYANQPGRMVRMARYLPSAQTPRSNIR